MDKASEVILALKPVTFKYNSDVKGTPCFGLIAEDVAQVDRDLVVRDKNCEVQTVRYEQINAMLLNEFLKEYRKVEQQDRKMKEQNASIAELKSGMEALTATVKEQDAQIQKVSAQLEVSKPAPQTVLNNQ
jgi:methyl-accepting chemotaxis protein